jgi:hypothetical protein
MTEYDATMTMPKKNGASAVGRHSPAETTHARRANPTRRVAAQTTPSYISFARRDARFSTPPPVRSSSTRPTTGHAFHFLPFPSSIPFPSIRFDAITLEMCDLTDVFLSRSFSIAESLPARTSCHTMWHVMSCDGMEWRAEASRSPSPCLHMSRHVMLYILHVTLHVHSNIPIPRKASLSSREIDRRVPRLGIGICVTPKQ